MSDSEAPQEVVPETMETAAEETPVEEAVVEPQAEEIMEEAPEEAGPEIETSVVVTDDVVTDDVVTDDVLTDDVAPPGTEPELPMMEGEQSVDPEQPIAGPEKPVAGPEEPPREEAAPQAAEPIPEVDPETRAMIEDLDSELPDEIDSPKVLVQCLAESTSEDTLKEYFSKFGEVRIAKLKKDQEGKSKGFAFVIFSDTANIAKALEQSDHEIDETVAKLSKAMPSSEKMKTNKLFVGGLPAALSEEQLRVYFEKYGKIQNFQFIVNKMTNTRKAFCFILFESSEAVEKITEGKIPPNSVVHTIEGHTVDCKKKFDEDHPVQKKIKARSAQYNSNRQHNYHNSNNYSAQGQYDASAAGAYAGYGAYGAYSGYEQYYGAYGAYGYPGYGYPYPGYAYPGYAYPQAQAYGSSQYGPVKQNRSNSSYKPY